MFPGNDYRTAWESGAGNGNRYFRNMIYIGINHSKGAFSYWPLSLVFHIHSSTHFLLLAFSYWRLAFGFIFTHLLI